MFNLLRIKSLQVSETITQGFAGTDQPSLNSYGVQIVALNVQCFLLNNIKSCLADSNICLSLLYLGKTKEVLACFFTNLSQWQI